MAPDPSTPLSKLQLGPPAMRALAGLGSTVAEIVARYPTPEELLSLSGIGPKVAAKIFGTANPPEAPAASSVEPPGGWVSSGRSRPPFPGSLTEEERLLGDLLLQAAGAGPLSDQKALMVAQALRKALDEFRNPKADA